MSSPDSAPLQQTNILIVDDLPEKLLVFRSVLEDLGQNLVFAHSGNDALREVLQQEFAVILLDVNMPGIDGFETAGLIRKYSRSAHTPIIFITSYADEIQTVKGYALGAVDYILSPVVPEVLRTKVKVFVELHLMQRHLRRQADERVALMAAETARRVAEENDRRSQYLALASRVLGGSLDVSVGMRQLVELVVPELASVAIVALQLDDGAFGDLMVAAESAADGYRVAQPDWPSLDSGLRAAFHQVRQSGRPMLLSDRLLASLGRQGCGLGGDASEPAAPLALRAGLVLPLLVGERVSGAVMVAADASRPDVPAQWSVLEDLTGRAAIAFENARLYGSLQKEIVERRAAEVELQTANQRKDEFLAMLSHELRNPLAPIRNALEVIRRIAPPDPRMTWAGNVMDRQVHHMTRLVAELLDVARISQGKIVLNREPIDLATVINHSVETAQPVLDGKRHVLQVQLPEQPLWLHGDFARLSQIVSNLLHNAAKFSEEGSRVELGLAADGDGAAVISVRDHGIGIDATLLPHIFELFAQGSRSLDRSQGGLGVGLTLARRLAQLHGGDIAASSAGVGQGAEFRVRLPCMSVVPQAAGAAAAGSAPLAPRGRRVLIVDDNHDAAESVARFLELEGHEVKSVGDGFQALSSAPVFAPHVVVLDIGLPGIDGYEVARRMRLLPATRAALIVALTGYGQKEDQHRAHLAGFDHHFVKPTDPRALVKLIAEWDDGGLGQSVRTPTAG